VSLRLLTTRSSVARRSGTHAVRSSKTRGQYLGPKSHRLVKARTGEPEVLVLSYLLLDDESIRLYVRASLVA
jgi:hypothetical protein